MICNSKGFYNTKKRKCKPKLPFKAKPRLQKSNRGLDKAKTNVNRYTPGMVQMSFFIIFHWPVLRSYWQFTKHFQLASSIFGLSALK
jgi:hypothetical protein